MNHCLTILQIAVLSGCTSIQAQSDSTQSLNAAAQAAPKDSDAKCRALELSQAPRSMRAVAPGWMDSSSADGASRLYISSLARPRG